MISTRSTSGCGPFEIIRADLSVHERKARDAEDAKSFAEGAEVGSVSGRRGSRAEAMDAGARIRRCRTLASRIWMKIREDRRPRHLHPILRSPLVVTRGAPVEALL
jgi:hypothetical protein